MFSLGSSEADFARFAVLALPLPLDAVVLASTATAGGASSPDVGDDAASRTRDERRRVERDGIVRDEFEDGRFGVCRGHTSMRVRVW